MWPARGRCANEAICARPEDWEQLRTPLAAHGLVLPTHIPQGALLCLDDQFAIRATHSPVPPLNVLDSVDQSNDGQAHTPLREVAPMIEAYEIMSNADKYEHMWRFARMKQR